MLCCPRTCPTLEKSRTGTSRKGSAGSCGTGAASHALLAIPPLVLAEVEAISSHKSSKFLALHAPGHGGKVVQLHDAVEALGLSVQQGLYVDKSVFYDVLKKCIKVKDLALGKHVHALAVQSGYASNAFLANHIICMYASHRKLDEALHAFVQVAAPSRYMWASIILAHARLGQPTRAISLYGQMRQSAVNPDNHIFVAVLKACAAAKDLFSGSRVHADIMQIADKPNIFVGNCLLDMYSKCGSLERARRVFDNLARKDVVTWNAMIAGYTQHGLVHEALSLHSCMEHEGLTSADAVTFAILLQACTNAGAFHQGKQLHALILEKRLQADMVLDTCLVDMYAQCGSLEDARKVFDILPTRDVITWNAMMAGYIRHGLGQEALTLYAVMRNEGNIRADKVTYISILQACAIVGDLCQGKHIHAQIEERLLKVDVVLGTCLVDMYAKCGQMHDACQVFRNMRIKNVLTWTAMIGGYAHMGLGQEALYLFGNMQKDCTTPANAITFVCLLQACASIGALHQGKQIHAQIKERDLDDNLVIGNSLVNMYSKCGSLENARRVFDKMSVRDVVTWNSMIAGYAAHGLCEEALALHYHMQQDSSTEGDAVTFVCLLGACRGAAGLERGKEIHAHIFKVGLQVTDLFLANPLIDMYLKCGSLEDACILFHSLPTKDVVTWTVMIAGHVQHELIQEAFALHASMHQEGITAAGAPIFVCLLQASARAGDLYKGQQLHEQILGTGLQADIVVGTSLVDMYAKCGSLEDARRVFASFSSRDVVMWNAMIAGYVHHGNVEEALALYASMLQEGNPVADYVTYVCLLQACDSPRALHQGRQLHGRIKERRLQYDVVVGSCLVVMYSKCGSLQEARVVFDHLPVKNVVTWTAMIAAYAQDGLAQEALFLYRKMELAGVGPANAITFVCLLHACGSVAALEMGEKIHAEVSRIGIDKTDILLANALIDMYGKCGSMVAAHQMFDALPEKDIVTWTALLAGYARQGESTLVFSLFDAARLEGMQPDGVTFLCLLTVCCHGGLVEEGQQYFEAMSRDHGIMPSIEHYTCMIDLLGRAGHVDKAMDVVTRMPFQPCSAVWRCLLGACQKWGKVELGRQAFEGAMQLDQQDAAAYVLMSNIYAAAQLHKDARDIRAMRLNARAWKKPGQSWWTDSSGIVHTFMVSEKVDPGWQYMDTKMKRLITQQGHANSVLRDIAVEEEITLCGHSEQLAIAYALKKTHDSSTIRVVKNLRICQDCHMSIALISKMEKRTIVCRDADRFHVYKDGKCSCGGYR